MGKEMGWNKKWHAQAAAHAPGEEAHRQAWQPEMPSQNIEGHSVGRVRKQETKVHWANAEGK